MKTIYFYNGSSFSIQVRSLDPTVKPRGFGRGREVSYIFCLLLFLGWSQMIYGWVLNNPYPVDESSQKIYYSSFSEQPKTLDPARSYSANEYQFINQIYEPPLQYDYLARPYQVVPLLAKELPEIVYLDKNSQPLPEHERDKAAYSIFRIHIKPGILYQPHPALAMDKQGHYRYLQLGADFLDDNDINNLNDFPYTGTREVQAEDFIYEIKRLADPSVGSPIAGLMGEYIVGFQEFASLLPKEKTPGVFVDLRDYSMEGLRRIDAYTFEIVISGVYPQFPFWLAMPFFSPVPWEADCFYSQPGMEDNNITFDWYPIGTGPFLMEENNPNSEIVLKKNPNFRLETFPSEGSEEDRKSGYLKRSGQKLPLIHKAIYTLEKESIPRWNKFLQGYYDISGVTADSFNQAIQINEAGEAELTPTMIAKKVKLHKSIDPSIYYMGFNMLDPIVGGKSNRARLLRQAISIAVNYDENIAIFFNGRGLPAQGPLPPGIFGYREGKESINPFVYRWNGYNGVRLPITKALELMRKAGYPGGRNQKTGQRLKLYYDVPLTGGPDDKALLDWMRKQFSKIGIRLVVRGTLYNRFQDKMRAGNAQIYSWGWNADYPDPENFLFLLYSGNGKVKYGGENASNYENPEYDKLFLQMKSEEDGPKRQAIIDKMVAILRYDAPWAFGMHTETLALSQQWISDVKPGAFTMGNLQYMAVDLATRNKLRTLWNQPLLWPLVLVFFIIGLFVVALTIAYRHKDRRQARRF